MLPNSESSEESRKRPRVLSACIICRKRKVKCDKTKPSCLVCVKHNIAHLCEYMGPGWASSSAANTSLNQSKTSTASTSVNQSRRTTESPEPVKVSPTLAITTDSTPLSTSSPSAIQRDLEIIAGLKRKIVDLEYELNQYKNQEAERPYDHVDEVISFRSKRTTLDPTLKTVTNISPLSGKILIQKDPFTMKFREVLNFEELKHNTKLHYEVLNMKPLVGEEKISNHALERQFRNKVLEALSVTLGVGKGLKKSDQADSEKALAPLPLRLGMNNFSFEWDLKIVKKAKGVLPNKRTTWLLLDRFFKYVHPFAPYVDQKYFFNTMEAIIGQRSEKEEKIKLEIEKRFDLISLSLLLLFVYLGSLTLYDCKKNPVKECETDPDVKYLISNPLSDKILTMAQLCSSPFHVIRMSSVRVLQALMYMKIAFRHSPEEAENLESEVFSALMFQMALCIGLNREPSEYEDFMTQSNYINVWRKLWHGLNTNDTFQNFEGDTFFSRFTGQDTKLPVFVGESNSNNYDLSIEQGSIYFIHMRHDFDQVYKQIAGLSLNLKNDPTVIAILEKISLLENMVDRKFKPISETILVPISPDDTMHTRIKKVVDFNTYLEASSLLSTLYFHFYVFYEEKRKTAFALKFLKKILELNLELVFTCSKSLLSLDKYIGSGMDWVLIPNILSSFTRVQWLLSTFTMRMRHAYYVTQMKGAMTKELGCVINDICENITLQYKSLMTYFNELSSYYYYAWKSKKTQSFLFHKVKTFNDKVFDLSTEPGVDQRGLEGNAVCDFSIESLHEILGILKKYARQPESESVLTGPSRNLERTDSQFGFGVEESANVDTNWINRMVANRMEFMGFNKDAYIPMYQQDNELVAESASESSATPYDDQNGNKATVPLPTAGTAEMVASRTSFEYLPSHRLSSVKQVQTGSQNLNTPTQPAMTFSGDAMSNRNGAGANLAELFEDLDDTLRRAIAPFDEI